MNTVSEIRRTTVGTPFFSICIPQHNRTRFLLQACKSLRDQTFKEFEVCISDDCSTDGLESELLAFLSSTDVSFVYTRQPNNLRYDGNLRSSIDLAHGIYVFLLGNDDALAAPDTLSRLHASIIETAPAGVVVTDYEDFVTTRRAHRTRQVGVIGSGPRVAARSFRNYSFVGGILLDRASAQAHRTDRWDGSEMYQMYLASRIVAEGRMLAHIDQVTVRKDIQIVGAVVDSYARKPRVSPCPIVERPLPMGLIGRLVTDAVAPYTSCSERTHIIENILFQLYLFTYAFWIIEYRRVQSWRFAFGVLLGLRPRNTAAGLRLPAIARLRIGLLYAMVGFLGLACPIDLFDAVRTPLYDIAKRFR